ncbi:MAG: transposase [Nitrospira sp.]|nr:transposase [Nitrospira sp.]
MPARPNVSKKRGKAKIKVTEKRTRLMNSLVDSYSEEPDMIASVIQELIPLGLQAVARELQNEVKRLVGQRHERGSENSRWGAQNGSIYLRDQKVPIKVPRVRDTRANQEVPLTFYQKLQTPLQDDRQTILKLLNGISTRKYQESSELVPEVFGISPSSLSKRFKVKTADALRKLQDRSLANDDIICIFIDAKRFAKDNLMVAMGVTIDGKKIILGIEQTHSENSKVVEQFLNHLIERGLRFEQGILFIIDGSKGIRCGIESTFREHGFIQRCQWHKRENVIAYLDPAKQALCRRRMQDAYKETTYKKAKARLEQLHQELMRFNQSAATSLLEGLEETLCLHRLGLSPEIGKSLNTTNCIESVMSQIEQYTQKVDRWHNSGQILRWNAASLLEIEPRLRKIRGFRLLKVLRYKMTKEIKRRSDGKTSTSAMTEAEIVDSLAI